MMYNNLEFQTVTKTDFFTIYYNKDLEMVICIADSEYIPIEKFKTIFEEISNLSNEFEIHHFVFDKRNLRTFHQPSMEWYFSVWKPIMKLKGLKNHYKLLPELDWFVKAVEAGKQEIYQKFGKDITNGLSIKYIESIEDAVQEVVITKNNA